MARQPAPSNLFDSLDLSCTQQQKRQVDDAASVDENEGRRHVQSARDPEPTCSKKLPDSSEEPPPLLQNSHHSGHAQALPSREHLSSGLSTPLPRPEAHGVAVGAAPVTTKGYAAMKAEVPSSRQHMPVVPVKLAVHDSRWGKGTETEEDREKRLRREKALAYAEECREKSRQVTLPCFFHPISTAPSHAQLNSISFSVFPGSDKRTAAKKKRPPTAAQRRQSSLGGIFGWTVKCEGRGVRVWAVRREVLE